MKVWLATGRFFDLHQSELAVIPIGSLERHGDFLPLGTDTLTAIRLAEDIGEKLSADTYPPIWYGASPYFKFAKGTISIEQDALRKYIYSILTEIARQGYKLVVIVNGHGGNTNIIMYICQDIVNSEIYKTAFLIIDWWRDLGQSLRNKLFKSPGHAGDDETSIMLYLYNKYVDREYADKKEVKYPSKPTTKYYSPVYNQLLVPQAYLGDPSKASEEKGKQWYKKILEDAINLIKTTLKENENSD